MPALSLTAPERGRSAYSAIAAQARADAQHRRPKIPKLLADPQLAAHLTARLQARDSPMTVTIEFIRGVHGLVAQLSHECTYQALYAQRRRGLPRGLHAGLHRCRRCPKHRRPDGIRTTKASPLVRFNLIGLRHVVAAERSEVGHLEAEPHSPWQRPSHHHVRRRLNPADASARTHCSSSARCPSGTSNDPAKPLAPTHRTIHRHHPPDLTERYWG